MLLSQVAQSSYGPCPTTNPVNFIEPTSQNIIFTAVDTGEDGVAAGGYLSSSPLKVSVITYFRYPSSPLASLKF